MKYLLVLAVVMVGFWIWRSNRQSEQKTVRPPPASPAQRTPAIMVACQACGTHLPKDDAVAGQRGHYCNAEHRRQVEGSAG